MKVMEGGQSPHERATAPASNILKSSGQGGVPRLTGSFVLWVFVRVGGPSNERTHMVHSGRRAGCVFLVRGRGSGVGIGGALWTAACTVGGAGRVDEADVENGGGMVDHEGEVVEHVVGVGTEGGGGGGLVDGAGWGRGGGATAGEGAAGDVAGGVGGGVVVVVEVEGELCVHVDHLPAGGWGWTGKESGGRTLLLSGRQSRGGP